MGQLKWNYTPKMEPSILRILSIRTFSNMRSRSQHSTNLLTGLAPKRPLMASPPELDLLRASLRNSAADVTCFYTKYTSLRREVIKAHTFICIYIIYIYICNYHVQMYLYKHMYLLRGISRYITYIFWGQYVLLRCLLPPKCAKHQHCPKPRLYPFHLDPISIPGYSILICCMISRKP